MTPSNPLECEGLKIRGFHSWIWSCDEKSSHINCPAGVVLPDVRFPYNRRANLRPATIAQNAWNSRRRKNRSGYKGVWYAKDKGKFRAAIWHNNKREYLGYFDCPICAAKAYDRAAKKYHGEFASLNFDK